MPPTASRAIRDRSRTRIRCRLAASRPPDFADVRRELAADAELEAAGFAPGRSEPSKRPSPTRCRARSQASPRGSSPVSPQRPSIALRGRGWSGLEAESSGLRRPGSATRRWPSERCSPTPRTGSPTTSRSNAPSLFEGPTRPLAGSVDPAGGHDQALGARVLRVARREHERRARRLHEHAARAGRGHDEHAIDLVADTCRTACAA